MGRSWFYPPDDVTAGEWRYLSRRFTAADVQERRERLVVTLRRVVRKGANPEQLHRALMLGIRMWEEHDTGLVNKTTAKRRDAAVARARGDVDRALASLRRLVPADLRIDDDRLFRMREALLRPSDRRPTPRKRGRPVVEWKRTAENALRAVGLNQSDRRELLVALGFADDN
jgi:hypothetical protein